MTSKSPTKSTSTTPFSQPLGGEVSQSNRRARMGCIAVLLIFLCWFAWNLSSGFQPSLILTVDANKNGRASLYVDHGNGLEFVPSLISYYHSQTTPTQMVFPFDSERSQKIRFDPVFFTKEEAISIQVFEIGVRVALFSDPILIPLSSLSPVVGVQQIKKEGFLNLNIPAHTLDPQMALRMPAGLKEQRERAIILSQFKLIGILSTALLLSLGIYYFSEQFIFHSRNSTP